MHDQQRHGLLKYVAAWCRLHNRWTDGEQSRTDGCTQDAIICVRVGVCACTVQARVFLAQCLGRRYRLFLSAMDDSRDSEDLTEG